MSNFGRGRWLCCCGTLHFVFPTLRRFARMPSPGTGERSGASGCALKRPASQCTCRSREALKLALGRAATPRNAAQDCPYYFWNGNTSRRAVVGIAERTLQRCSRNQASRTPTLTGTGTRSPPGCWSRAPPSSRSRTSWGTAQTVVRKHYGKWSKGRQDNIDRLMMAHFQTAAAHSQSQKSHTKKPGRKLMKTKEIFWCGEGDLNPHEIAPASTSS